MFVDISLGSISCGQDSNGVLFVPSSLEPVTINCTVQINDDLVSHENDEQYRLNISLINPDPDTVPVVPGDRILLLTIVDDDGQ